MKRQPKYPKVLEKPTPTLSEIDEVFVDKMFSEEAGSDRQFLFTVANSPESWAAYIAGEAGIGVDPRTGGDHFRRHMIRVAALALAAYQWSLKQEKGS